MRLSPVQYLWEKFVHGVCLKGSYFDVSWTVIGKDSITVCFERNFNGEQHRLRAGIGYPEQPLPKGCLFLQLLVALGQLHTNPFLLISLYQKASLLHFKLARLNTISADRPAATTARKWPQCHVKNVWSQQVQIYLFISSVSKIFEYIYFNCITMSTHVLYNNYSSVSINSYQLNKFLQAAP